METPRAGPKFRDGMMGLYIHIYMAFHTHILIIWGMNNIPVSGCSSETASPLRYEEQQDKSDIYMHGKLKSVFASKMQIKNRNTGEEEEKGMLKTRT
jgi:hypothetical protein